MSLHSLTQSDCPPPLLLVGGSKSQAQMQARQLAKPWGAEIVDWSHSRIMMSEQPGEGQVGLGQLRSVFHLQPGHRQTILLNLDGAGIEVQNALLKSFEEPTSDTWIIALASNLGHILPTLRSRCHLAQISPLSEEELAEWIQTNCPNLDPLVAQCCGRDLDCLTWASEHTDAAQAAVQGDIPALLSYIRESEAAAWETGFILMLMHQSGRYETREAQQILKRGSKPEAALALASLSAT